MKEYGNILGLHYPFARNENFPLDADSLFESYEEALSYARGGVNGSETSYLGQIISVVEEDASGNTNVQVYKVVVEGKMTRQKVLELEKGIEIEFRKVDTDKRVNLMEIIK